MAALEIASTPLYSDPNITHYWKLEDLNATIGGRTLSNPTSKSFVSALFSNGIDMGSSIRNTLELNTTTNSIPTATSAFSITLWFKMNIALSGSNVDPGLLICSTGAAGGYAVAIIPQWASGAPRIRVTRRTSSDAHDDVSFGNDTTTWHNIVHTYASGTMVNYLDGVAFSAGVASSGTFSAGAYPELSIGGSFMSSSATAIIDDVAFFSRALTASEAENIYTGNFGGGGSATPTQMLMGVGT